MRVVGLAAAVVVGEGAGGGRDVVLAGNLG